MNNINDGDSYAKYLVGKLRAEFHAKAMDEKFVDYICEEVEAFAKKAWQNYITGRRPSQYITQAEFRVLYENASKEYVNHVMEKLIDEDKLTVSVNQEGNMIYQLTAKGKQQGLT